jgi:hypothetical protein
MSVEKKPFNTEEHLQKESNMPDKALEKIPNFSPRSLKSIG